MKKNLKIYLGIILIFVILGVCAIVFYFQSKKVNNKSYSTITYLANYNTRDVLNNSKEYEIVTEKNRLDEILKKVNSSEFSEINDDFFKNQSLLVIQAGLNPEIHKLKIKDTKVDISIYEDTPEISVDQMLTFSLYLIPINKNVNNCNVEISPYPNRIY